MTAIVILNIVFAVIVVGGMLALLGSAIVRDARANGQPSALRLRSRPTRQRPQPRPERAWRHELDPAR